MRVCTRLAQRVPVLHLFDDDLNTIISIDRSDVGYVRKAGDFILRMAYHEAVHAGQVFIHGWCVTAISLGLVLP
jgi:hypothetical protein